MDTASATRAERERPNLSLSWRSHPIVTALVVAFAGVLIVALIQGPRPFYGDSSKYWRLASEFTRGGHFSLLNYADPLRGYAFPLAIYVLKMFASNTPVGKSDAATIFNVALFTLIGAVLAPQLAEITWPERRWGVFHRIALMALLLIFWSGDLSYPLTDFPALTIALFALAAISRSDSPAWMLLAGAAAGLAFNLRPAYLLLIPMLFVIVALAWFDQRGTRHASTARRAVGMALLVIGLVLVSLPQSLAVHRHYNTWSPVPGFKMAAGSNISITEEVLTKGMYEQRWDSFERPLGTPNAIAFPDVSGQRLLEQQPEQIIKSNGQYLGLVVSHPTVMIPLLVRHIINGLDARYSTIYVEKDPNGGHIWLRIGGFLLLFLALVRLLWPAARRRLGRVRWRYPLALAVCVLTAIPSAIETRYMLPIYLLTYILVITPGWPTPIGPAEAGLSRYRVLCVLAIAALVFGGFIWHMLSGVHSYVFYPL